MRYREIGRTGVLVSEIGLGGEWVNKDDPQAARALFDRCEQAGINVLDCWMADPTMRSTLGHALRGRRDKWVIQGHIGSTWHNGQYERSRDMGRVAPAFEDLLERLGTDHVEFGMLHFVDTAQDYDVVMAPQDSCLAYARELRERGVIGHIGMSTHNPAIALRAALSGEVELVMFSCNPAFDMLGNDVEIDRLFKDETFGDLSSGGISPERARLYATCEERGVGITVMKGFEGGRLLREQDSPFGVALTPVQCLHYALTRPAVASVLVGFSDPSQVDEAVAYETATPDELDYASVLSSAPRNAFAGRCTYCGHCAPCPVRIDVAMVQKYADLAAMQVAATGEVPESVADHYRLLEAHAGDCMGCGSCERRCPFGVPVVERMGQIARLFGE